MPPGESLRVKKLLATLTILALLPLGQALAFTASVRPAPYADVLTLALPGQTAASCQVRRSAPREIELRLPAGSAETLAAQPRLESAAFVDALLPVPGGLLIRTRTSAFTLSHAALPGGGLELRLQAEGAPVARAAAPVAAHTPELLAPLTAAPETKPPAVAAAPATPVSPALSALPALPVLPVLAASAAPRALPAQAFRAPLSAAGLPVAPVQAAPVQSAPIPAATSPAVAAAPLLPASLSQADTSQAIPSETPAQPEPGQVRDALPAPGEAAVPQAPARPTLRTELSGPDGPAVSGRATPDASPTRALSLREALDLALRANPRLQAARLRADGAQYGALSARGALLPHASVGAGVSRIVNPNNGNERDADYVNQVTKSANIQVSQNIFDGLVRLNSWSRAKLLSGRAAQERRKAELDTIEAVQREYFKLLRVRSDIRTYRASLARLENQREAAQAFYRLEMAPRLTVLQVETMLAQTGQKLSRAVSDELVQKVKLAALLGVSGQEAASGLEFAGDLKAQSYELGLDFEDCLRKAQAQLPEMVIAKADADIAREELNISIGKALPRVDAQAAYIRQNTDYKSSASTDLDRRYYTMGLNVSWEVFSSGEHYYEIEARRKLAKAAQEELGNAGLAVRAYVRESHLNAAEARNQIRIAHLRSGEAAEAYDQASMRFRSGIGTSIDLLDAHEKVTSAEAALNQARGDFLTAVASLYRAMGEKDANLALLAGQDPASDR